jgi:hypothetical protein
MSQAPANNWETIAESMGITGNASSQSKTALPTNNSTAPVNLGVEEVKIQLPTRLRQIKHSLEFKRPPESRSLTTANLRSFESNFPETRNIKRVNVHADTICSADFPALALRLDGYIHLQNISGDDKYNRVEGQLKRCIAKRILTHKGALRHPNRSKASDQRHLGHIIQLYDMYKNFEKRYAAGTFDEVSKIEWIPTTSRFGTDGYFQVTYTHTPPPAPVVPATTATTNRSAWGGKRTTRKMRKSKKRQTRNQ